jgi:hypothetical protein
MTPSWEGGALQVVDLLVDLVGIEPTTSSMPWKRAPSCATGPHKKGSPYFLLRIVISSNCPSLFNLLTLAQIVLFPAPATIMLLFSIESFICTLQIIVLRGVS